MSELIERVKAQLLIDLRKARKVLEERGNTKEKQKFETLFWNVRNALGDVTLPASSTILNSETTGPANKQEESKFIPDPQTSKPGEFKQGL